MALGSGSKEKFTQKSFPYHLNFSLPRYAGLDQPSRFKVLIKLQLDFDCCFTVNSRSTKTIVEWGLWVKGNP